LLYRPAIDVGIKTGQTYIITYADKKPASQKFEQADENKIFFRVCQYK
jgi:hypothetical protein